MTKPRPRASRAAAPDPEAMYAEARKHIAVTKRRVTQIMAEQGANRSTRAQRAQRCKAEAFERLDDILAGRE